MGETDQRVATQLSVTIADVSRKEWPGGWDELFAGLLGGLAGTDLSIMRAAYTLHRVLKELSTKRLARDRMPFVALSVALFPPVTAAWTERSAQLHASPSQPLAELVTYLTKAMGTTVLCAFPNSLQADASGIPPADIAGLFGRLLDNLAILSGVAKAVAATPLGPQIGKLLYRTGKIIVDTQLQSPLPFRAFLGPFLQYFHESLISLYTLPPPPGPGEGVGAFPATPCTNPPALERAGINSILFMSNVLGCREYNRELAVQLSVSASHRAVSATGDQERSAGAVGEAAAAVDAFLTDERAGALLDIIVHTFLPLRQEDLEAWGEDAEGYHLTQVSLLPPESPRAAAEELLGALLSARPQLLG